MRWREFIGYGSEDRESDSSGLEEMPIGIQELYRTEAGRQSTILRRVIMSTLAFDNV